MKSLRALLIHKGVKRRPDSSATLPRLRALLIHKGVKPYNRSIWLL